MDLEDIEDVEDMEDVEIEKADDEVDSITASELTPIPIVPIKDYLLATIHTEISDVLAQKMLKDITNELYESGSNGLIIDITSVQIVDSYIARILDKIGRMAKMMGCDTVIVGMQPQVAMTLTEMGLQVEGVKSALNVDKGIELLDDMKEGK